MKKIKNRSWWKKLSCPLKGGIIGLIIPAVIFGVTEILFPFKLWGLVFIAMPYILMEIPIIIIKNIFSIPFLVEWCEIIFCRLSFLGYLAALTFWFLIGGFLGLLVDYIKSKR